MVENADPAKTAAIDVYHRPPGFIGLLGRGWLVFVDGVWVADAPRERTVRIPVTPGTHTVRLWVKGGRQCSNELRVTLVPAEVRTLVGTVNGRLWGQIRGVGAPRAKWLLGGAVGTNLASIGQVARDGWVVKNALVLEEVVPPPDAFRAPGS